MKYVEIRMLPPAAQIRALAVLTSRGVLFRAPPARVETSVVRGANGVRRQ